MQRALSPVALGSALVLSSCSPPDDGLPRDPAPADTSTGPTDPLPDGPPERIALDCEPTPNALRFDCRVQVEPAQPVEVRFSRADGLGAERIHTSASASAEHRVPLYLMAPEATYRVVATAARWPDHRRATAAVITARPPPEIDSWLEIEGASTAGLIGTDLPCSTAAVAVIYDTGSGDPLWYQELDPTGQLGFLDMIRFTDRRTVLGETDGAIVEVDLAGRELVRLEQGVDYQERLHHDIAERDDWYYVLYQEKEGGRILDAMLVLDRSGTTVARWRAVEHLPIPPRATGDWMHTNTVSIDPDGDILLSLRNQSTVVKLEGDLASPEFGDPIWILAGGPPAGFGSDFAVDWSSIPLPGAFQEQHHVQIRRDGRLSLLDNPHGRALVLSVDPKRGLATADAAYPAALTRCGPQGTATETPVGNPVVGCAAGALREYDRETGGLVWEATARCRTLGRAGGIGGVRWYPLEGW